MRKQLLLFTSIGISLLLLMSFRTAQQEQDDSGSSTAICGLSNSSYGAGENVTFNIYYSVIGIYVHAGTANAAVSTSKLHGRSVYHVIGTGWTNAKYDWIFKVRDRYESYIDEQTMLPIQFERDVHEGSYSRQQVLYFNHSAGKVSGSKGTFKIPACTQDIISGVYNMRNINFDAYKINDRIPFDMFLDDDLYHMYIRYMGKETTKTKFGKFKAIKCKLLLLKGRTFKGGEGMTVWISNDGNHLPLRIESGLTVGSIKVDLMGAKGLRHPFSSKL